MTSNKYGLVDINGGFGNQLFQYSFANFLKLNGLKIRINTNWFSEINKFPREQIFYPEFYGLKKANKSVLKYYEVLNKKKGGKYYFENFNDSIDTDNFKKFNRFTGYWQDLDYLKLSKQFLISKLEQNEHIKSGIDFLPEKNNVLIHVRRGDYLLAKKIIDDSYFENAIQRIKNHVEYPKFNVFTDDKEWVKSSPIFKNVENIYSSSSSKEDTITTFSLMLKNKHFIISNSTYSYLAAYFKSDNDSIVTIPEPWMPNNAKNYNIYPENWLKIKSS